MAKLSRQKKTPPKNRRVRIAIIAGGAVVVVVVLFFVIRSATKVTPGVYNEDPAVIRQNEIKALEKLRDDEVGKATKAGWPAAEIEKLKARFQTEIDNVSKRENRGKVRDGSAGYHGFSIIDTICVASRLIAC